MNPPSPSQRFPIPLRPPLISYQSSTACHYLLALTPLQVSPVLLPLLVLHHRLLPVVPRPPPRGLLSVLLPLLVLHHRLLPTVPGPPLRELLPLALVPLTPTMCWSRQGPPLYVM
jgi:hypothetical protein